MQAFVNSSLYFFGSGREGDVIVTGERNAEEIEYMKNGKRGVLVFHCTQLLPVIPSGSPRTCTSAEQVHTEEEQYLHLNYYNGTLEIYRENEIKTLKLYDITLMERSSDNKFHLQCGSSKAPPMLYQFHGPLLADIFQQYVEYWQDSGIVIQKAFDMLDKKGKGIVTTENLTEVLYHQEVASQPDHDITETSSDDALIVQRMLSMNTPAGRTTDVFDYADFFHIFLDIPMFSLYSCLIEWKSQCNGILPGQLSAFKLTSKIKLQSNSADYKLLPGEVLANIIENVKWYIGGTMSSITSVFKKLCNSEYNTNETQNVSFSYPKEGLFAPPFIFGTLVITNYRILMVARRCIDRADCRYGIPHYFNRLDIPLSCVALITLASPSNKPFRSQLNDNCCHQSCIQVQTKDVRSVFLVLQKQQHDGAATIVHTLHQMCFSGVRAHLFAYQYMRRFEYDAWALSDIRVDYQRMNLNENPDWQVIDNSTFELSESYPPFLILPSCMSIKNISEAARHRSRQRLPVVTYRDGISGACLLRSAQPLVGIRQHTSVNDEVLLNACRLAGSITSTCSKEQEEGYDGTHNPPSQDISGHGKSFYIFDARGKIAANLNSVMGKGTEDVSRYTSTHLIFCNIYNIHVMRSSYSSLQDVVIPSIMGEDDDVSFYRKLHDCGWLKHTRQLLIAAVHAAEKLRISQSSVLIHCSDGWDRTSQLCLLIEIMLDPYYRTMKGLCVLIEKEFCSFGYRFQDRCGHAEAIDSMPDERSPVFIQCLDALYQIMQQFPYHFEYTTDLLVFIADHLNSGLFGNFLGNSEKERTQQLDVRRSTQSIWSYVLCNETQFLQRNYTQYNGALWPKTDMKRMELWERNYCRWNITSHPTVMQLNTADNEIQRWRDDWGDGLS